MSEDQGVEEVEEAAPAAEVAQAAPVEQASSGSESGDAVVSEEPSLWSKDEDASGQDADAAPEVEESPEWFMKDKYKSVEDQAKSAFDLQKKMGKNWGAPSEDYSFEGIDGVDASDPILSQPHRS